MKAVKIKKTGGPEVLNLEEITLRKPQNDEVLIEHVAIGLNYIDTYHRSGLYPLMMPTGLGMEAAGIIKEVGPNVSNFREIYKYLSKLDVTKEVNSSNELSLSLVEEFKDDKPKNLEISEKIENYGQNILNNVTLEIKKYI